jgi:type II secretory pathway pseudopilin PulG
MKQRGFTLIETGVAIIFGLTIIMFVVGVVNSVNGNSNISYGVNGMTESRCIEGYKFILDTKGTTRQILDEFGKGVRCENPNAGKPGSFGKM